jgi:hypothetical protein
MGCKNRIIGSRSKTRSSLLLNFFISIQEAGRERERKVFFMVDYNVRQIRLSETGG